MKIFFDISILVEIERKNKEVIELCKELVRKNVELIISVISISEILTGVYLREDSNKAARRAKELLMQFKWFKFDAEVADKTAKILAYRIAKGKKVEYQDDVIAASFLVSNSDFLLTLNLKHFNLPFLKEKVCLPKELKSKLE